MPVLSRDLLWSNASRLTSEQSDRHRQDLFNQIQQTRVLIEKTKQSIRQLLYRERL